MSHILILENIRSAYNTWVMLRTCDGLWRKVVLSGFTPRPDEDEKVCKTALGAEKEVIIWSFRNPKEARDRCRVQWYTLVASEKTSSAIAIQECSFTQKNSLAVLMGNENTGVLQESLDDADFVIHIPLQWVKESLNVAEAAAIMMWELTRITWK